MKPSAPEGSKPLPENYEREKEIIYRPLPAKPALIEKILIRLLILILVILVIIFIFNFLYKKGLLPSLPFLGN